MINNQINNYSNKEIAHLLRSVAAAYLLQNENRFKIIAYEKAADSVEHLSRELKDIWQDGKLKDVEGIGPSISSHLDEYFKTGKSKHFEEVKGKIPGAVFQLMRIPTLGPKKALKLVSALGLKNSDTAFTDLKKAAEAGKIATLPTFGEKSQQDILVALGLFEKRSVKEDRMPLPYAFSLAQEVLLYLKKNDKIVRADALGSLRRMAATIGDVDIAVEASENDSDSIVDYFTKYPRKQSVDNKGQKKASIIVTSNIRVDLRIQRKKSYGSMLQYFTGSKAHNIKLREYALKMGYSLSEYGIKDLTKEKLSEFRSEEEFYRFLKLQYIPPELREGTNEIDLAKKGRLPKLVVPADIMGDLHTHSSYDISPSHDAGVNSYLEMAKSAKKAVYEYIGFADHNPNISNNGREAIIAIMKRRKQYIDHNFTINKIDHSQYFIGLEVDILTTGEIALPAEAIEYVDYLVVAVHSSFQMNKEQMTKRVLKALSYPKVKILGHPTGRLLGKRDGFDLDWNLIFSTCKERNIAIEINAWPERLDLPDTLVRLAIQSGVKLVVNSDAHSADQMDNMLYAVSVARRGWAQKDDIMNTLPYDKFKQWLLS